MKRPCLYLVLFLLSAACQRAPEVSISEECAPEAPAPASSKAALSQSVITPAPRPLPPAPEVYYFPAELSREWLHSQILRGSTHDACGQLFEVGDKTSIPYLLKILRDIPPEDAICTRHHCLAALEEITGRRLGKREKTWRRWLLKRPEYAPFVDLPEGAEQSPSPAIDYDYERDVYEYGMLDEEGRRQGVWRAYASGGELVEEATYRHGERLSIASP